MEQKFIKASQAKIRFASRRGLLTTEDLWDLPLTQLDEIAKGLRKSLREAEDESFIAESKGASKTLELQFEVVFYIIQERLKARDEAKAAIAKRQYKEKLAGIIAEKEDSSLKELSLEDLKKLAAEA